MSAQDSARHAEIAVAFEGVDITADIRPYLLGLTYTDSEDDESDDLCIDLVDRDAVWLCDWLGATVEAASRSTGAYAGTKPYRVTAKIGLNIRSGEGTSYRRLGALPLGATVYVKSITPQGWASVVYGDRKAYMYARYLTPIDGGNSASAPKSSGDVGMVVSAAILRCNAAGDGLDKLLDCGTFELDRIDASSPPSTVTIRATSLPYCSPIRQTKRSQAWESYRLSGIGREIAERSGMTLMFECSHDPYFERLEQIDTTDIAFFSALCHDAGASLKVTNNIIVAFDQAEYERKDACFCIRRNDGSYTKCKLSVGAANTAYTSCRVRYFPPSGKLIEGIAYIAEYDKDSKDNKQLEVTAKVGSVVEAKNLAAMRLRRANRYSRTVSFTTPGNPDWLSGVTFEIDDFGLWSGKYIISKAKHTVNSRGYTTQIDARRVQEGE